MSAPLSRGRALLRFIGAESHSTSHLERLLSAIGAFAGLAITYLIATSYFGHPIEDASAVLLTSMGASAVLLFAVPHGALSQPWPVIGGNCLSAATGLACLTWLPSSVWQAPIAVGLATGVMYYTRCIHPPGGATALATVLGGSQVMNAGIGYLLFPVALNAISIVTIALLFNAPFPWRRYPAVLASSASVRHPSRGSALTAEDFAHATQQLDSFIDVNAEDLATLFELAVAHANASESHPAKIEPGAYYSNGELGPGWSIRQVIDMPESSKRRRRNKIIYKVVAGAQSYDTGVCDEEEFRLWARSEVKKSDGHWVRVRVPAHE